MPARSKDVWTWVTHADFNDMLYRNGHRTALYRNGKKVFSGWAEDFGLELARAIIGKRSVTAIQLTKLPETLDPRHWKDD